MTATKATEPDDQTVRQAFEVYLTLYGRWNQFDVMHSLTDEHVQRLAIVSMSPETKWRSHYLWLEASQASNPPF